MPDIGRFFNIDPLAEDYVYNGVYNFAENRVIDGRELEGLEKIDYRELLDNGLEKIGTALNGTVQKNTTGELNKQLENSQVVENNNSVSPDIQNSVENQELISTFNEGANETTRGAVVVGGEGIDDAGTAVSAAGYLAAPFTAGESLSLVKVGDGMSLIGKGMKTTIYTIDGDYDAATGEVLQGAFEIGTTKLVDKAVDATKAAGNVTKSQLDTTEGVLGTVSKIWNKTMETITDYIKNGR